MKKNYGKDFECLECQVKFSTAVDINFFPHCPNCGSDEKTSPAPSVQEQPIVSPQAIEEILERIKNCMPENPYSKQSDEWFTWDIAFDMIWDNINYEFEIDLAG